MNLVHYKLVVLWWCV